jgi:group I intron endonuclease
MKPGIYVISCVVTGQKYVGTALDWEKRIVQHLRKLRRGKHKNVKMQEAWTKYGPTSFEFKLIEECEVGDLLEREHFWVSELNSNIQGFNEARLGSNGNLTHGQTYS